MSRPRYKPGERIVLAVKRRSGKKPLSMYLASRLGIVETWAIDLLESGLVMLDGRLARKESLINLSADSHILEIVLPAVWPRHMGGVEIPLSILYEDSSMIALDKPPGIVVHPARGHLDGHTLQNGVRFRYRHLLEQDDVTIGPPHRLDMDTSGVVVFSLRKAAYTELVRQFTAGEPQKHYLAVLEGEPAFSEIVMQAAIGSNPEHPQRGKLVDSNQSGKKAETAFTILARGNGICLALAKPRTGRPHQIRLHAAGLGHPVVGDKEYNPDPARHWTGRQALHAFRLDLTHPLTREKLSFRAPLPPDLRQLLDQKAITHASFD